MLQPEDSDSDFDLLYHVDLLGNIAPQELRGQAKPFEIPGCGDEPPATQPVLNMPLREDQLRALGWMRRREGTGTFTSTFRRFWYAGQGDTSPVLLDMELKATFTSKGGILAHDVGFGKTALVIALISRTRLEGNTLIIAPPNLLDQWATEFVKFLGRGEKLSLHASKVQEIQKDGREISFFIVGSARSLKGVTEATLLSADVVLVSSRLFLSPVYLEHKSIVLEKLRWRRVVVDEIHEQLCIIPAPLHTDALWGLTATPSVNTLAGVTRFAEKFRVDLLGHKFPRSGAMYDASECVGDPHVSRTAQSFLNEFFRKDTFTPAATLVNHVETVHLAGAERILYLAAVQAHSDVLGALERNPDSLEPLVKLCSHFCSSNVSESAAAEVGRICRQKERAVAKAKNALQQCLRVLRWFGEEDIPGDDEYLRDVLAEVGGEDDEKTLHQLANYRLTTELADILGVTTETADRTVWSSPCCEEKRQKVIACGLTILHMAVGEVALACRAEAFFKASCKLVQDGARECTICMQDDVSLHQMCITFCGHAFCQPCVMESLLHRPQCAVCRTPLTKALVQPVVCEMRVSLVSEQAIKHGTKIYQVVALLKKIREEDPTAKVLLFCQWDDLRGRVSTALAELGVPSVHLYGAVSKRSAIIRDWQNNEDGKFVLTLSLLNSASGVNLTAANHVILLHPMLAPPEQRAAFEKQAIGRALRQGQERREVHVWRFVTADTVEVDLVAP